MGYFEADLRNKANHQSWCVHEIQVKWTRTDEITNLTTYFYQPKYAPARKKNEHSNINININGYALTNNNLNSLLAIFGNQP